MGVRSTGLTIKVDDAQANILCEAKVFNVWINVSIDAHYVRCNVECCSEVWIRCDESEMVFCDILWTWSWLIVAECTIDGSGLFGMNKFS